MKFKENKNLFIFNIDNVIDVITNSSSELFTFKMDNGKILSKILNNFKKDFNNKIGEPVSLRNCSNTLFRYYIYSIFPYQIESEEEIKDIILPPNIKFEDLYDSDTYTYTDSNTNEEKIYYHLKEEDYGDGFKVIADPICDRREELQEFLDPNDNIWLLYIDDYKMDTELRNKVKTIASYEHY